MPQINWVKITTFLQSVGAAPTSYIPIGAVPAAPGTAPFAEAAKVYASTTEMLDDGWIVTDAPYLAAVQYFGQTTFTQTPPTRLVVVSRAAATAQVSEFTVENDADGTWRLFISPQIGASPVEAASFVASSDTVTAIKDGLLASLAIGPFSALVTGASVDADSGSVTSNLPGVPFVLTGEGPVGAVDVTIVTTTPSLGIYEDLDAAFALHKFWAVIPDPAEVDGVKYEAGRWAEDSKAENSPRRNVALLQTDDVDILDDAEPNFASTLVALGYTRSFPLVHVPNTADKMTAAWFGRYGGQSPGTRAWHFAQLGGTTETDTLIFNETQVENAAAQRASIVERDGPTASDALRINWGQGGGGFFVVQKQAEDFWWFETGVAIVRELESASGLNMDSTGTDALIAAVDLVNTGLGSGDIPVIDLAETVVTAVDIDSIPAAEKELGDYQTTGGIEVSTDLIPKMRRVRVSATFSLD